jgi:hypothetical protein
VLITGVFDLERNRFDILNIIPGNSFMRTHFCHFLDIILIENKKGAIIELLTRLKGRIHLFLAFLWDRRPQGALVVALLGC